MERFLVVSESKGVYLGYGQWSFEHPEFTRAPTCVESEFGRIFIDSITWTDVRTVFVVPDLPDNKVTRRHAESLPGVVWSESILVSVAGAMNDDDEKDPSEEPTTLEGAD